MEKPYVGLRFWYWPSVAEIAAGQLRQESEDQPFMAFVTWGSGLQSAHAIVTDHFGNTVSRSNVPLVCFGDEIPQAKPYGVVYTPRPLNDISG